VSLRAPRTKIEIDVAAIWKEVLCVEHLSIDDDFLHLGGDSLKAMQIAARVADRFECDVRASAPLRWRPWPGWPRSSPPSKADMPEAMPSGRRNVRTARTSRVPRAY